jgi:hypothetical protein
MIGAYWRLTVTLVSTISAGCAMAATTTKWAERLEARLTCGMSESQVENLADGTLTSVGAGGRLGSHFMRHGGTDLWLTFDSAGLKTALIVKPRRMKRSEVSLRRNLCTGEDYQLARLYFSEAFQSSEVLLDGVSIGRLPVGGKPFDFEMVPGPHQLVVKTSEKSPVSIQLHSSERNDDGFVVVRLERSD